MSGENADLPAAFARAVAGGVVAHTWILLAPGRSRARAAAFACARALLRTDGDPRAHPDCAVFDPVELEVDGLRVEHVARRKAEVASVEDALRYLPVAGAHRAVLLPDADRMNADAQGALLKTAEEPPQGTVLLLTGVELGAFLPALRSRARVLRLPPVPAAELERRAAEAGLAGGGWERLREAVGAEAALELEPEERSFLAERLEELDAWLSGRDQEASWLADPEDAARGAEARARASLLLQAALGALLRSRGSGLEAESWADLLGSALADLDANVAPSLVLAELRRNPPPAAFKSS